MQPFFWMGHSRPLFMLVFSTQTKVQFFANKICHCQDSNHGSLVMEATALPTKPQTLPKHFMFKQIFLFKFCLGKCEERNLRSQTNTQSTVELVHRLPLLNDKSFELKILPDPLRLDLLKWLCNRYVPV